LADLVGSIDLSRHGVLEAHAGTGKTHTIVGLVVRLLRERRLAMGEILLVTYTQKAAGELVERIRKGISKAAREAVDPAEADHLRRNLANLGEGLVGTIHSTCLRLLQAHRFESGLPFTSRLCDDEEGLEECLRELLRRDDWKGGFARSEMVETIATARSMDDLLELAKGLAARLLDPRAKLHPPTLADFQDSSEPDRLAAAFAAKWALEAVAMWRRRKDEDGLVSFHDMLESMDRALERPSFLEAMRSQVKVGIVDEFQDTSALQWRIFRRWFLDDGPPAGNLYLVGDPKQSIYSFQGADVRTYQAACRDLLSSAGARRYQLRENWRSLPGLIEASNAIFREDCPLGWFQDPSILYDAESQSRPPARAGEPERKLSDEFHRNPVRIAKLEGPSPVAKAEYARLCAGWIRALNGREVDLPDGGSWKRRILDWGDFAVVVSTRTAAAPFRRAFDAQGIPWALYKEQGVFDSRAARETEAILRAVGAPPHDLPTRGLALATRLLEGNEAILDAMREAASQRRFARMFRLLEVDAGAGGRLLGSPQGDRQWMDFRQVAGECLEFLVAGQGGVPELCEHLRRLAEGLEQAGDDRNLLACATDRGRVQILTMHVSKGLEFPVVFLAGGAKKHGGIVRSWIDDEDGSPSPRLFPGFLKEDKKRPEWSAVVASAKERADRQQEQEARRLHYVAITRPKLLLVAPCHVKTTAKGAITPQGPLADALFAQWKSPSPGVWWLEEPPPAVDGAIQPQVPAGIAAVHEESELSDLSLPERTLHAASYTQVARSRNDLPLLEGRAHPSEEEAGASIAMEDLPDAWLPRGARTGDALHGILESWMGPEHDNSWMADGAIPPRTLAEVGRALSRHGVDPGLAERVASLLREVMVRPLPLPGGRHVRLCDVPPGDRRPETEFHWAFGEDGSPVRAGGKVAGWMVGYIDLMFRLEGVWYLLDWKTTSLATWTPETLEASVVEHAYDLQARLYGRTVASALPDGEAFGGAMVVYLRAFADAATMSCGVHVVEPGADDGTIDRRVRRWLHERGRVGGGRK